MKYTTVIFDLDGTLLNSLKDLQNSVNFALNKFHYSEKTIDEVRAKVGNGVEKLIERCIPEGITNQNYKECLKIFKENYSQNMDKNTKAYPHIMEMLSGLKEKGYKTAVVSNKFDVAVKPLCKRYFDGLINTSIGQTKDTKKKPAPDTVYLALDYLKSKMEEAVFVGDSEVDIQTARNAGIPCISVTWGYKSKEFLIKNNAKIMIDNPLDIFNYI